jgi:hypothetical protein
MNQNSDFRIGKGLRLTLATLAATSIPAMAQGPGWTSVSTVIELVNTSNGGVNVRLSPDLTGCTSQSGTARFTRASIPIIRASIASRPT